MKSLIRWCVSAVFVFPLLLPAVQADVQDVTFLMPAPPNLPGFAPWIIAQQKGYYAQLGLRVNWVTAKGGVDVAKQVGAGNALFGAASGDVPVIVRANGVPVRNVAVLGTHGYTLLATDAVQHIDAIEQLRGKTVTVMSYSDSLYYALLASLRKAGMSKNDVNIQAAGPAGVWQLLADGKADAMAGSPDWVVNAQEAGRPLQLIPQAQMFDSMAQSILASDDAIAQHPDLVQKMVDGTLMGLRDILQDPAQAARTFVAAVPAYQGKEHKVEQILALYRQYVYGHQERLGQIQPERVADSVRFFSEEGIVKSTLPTDEYFTNRFIGALPASQP
ncbi:ABC transporter substrate-binding protein [Pseudomonas silvicola]|nr:ABC transporter substrate-binding protein [Pseudomonas silvicola]